MRKLALGIAICLGLALPGLSFAKDIVIGFTSSETGKLNADSTPQLAWLRDVA